VIIMFSGNYVGGRLSDKFSAGKVAMYTQGVIFISLVFIYLFATNGVVSVLLMCLVTGCLFAISSPQQQLLLLYSPGGEMMGGAMVQLAFNLGNALGAFAGGVVINEGIGLEYTAIVGAAFAFIGVALLIIFNHLPHMFLKWQ